MVKTAEAGTRTPGDEAITTPTPGRGRRYRVFTDGDYLIFQLAPKDSNMPAGTLLPIPEMPRFESTNHAFTYLRNNGEAVQGMQLMIVRAQRILSAQSTKKVQVELIEKPRVVSHEPEKE